jgi:GT2 family glycosyltransferase
VRASIVIVSYNGCAYLNKCLESVLQETTSQDEIILVDNASSDNSISLVQQQWTQVKLISNVKNLGFATACNQGAGIARGETLVFLNQDTQVQKGWLDGLLAPLEQDMTIGLVTSKLLLMSDPEKIHMCGQDIHFTGLAFGRGFLSPSVGYILPNKVSAISGASFAIRRTLWEQLEGFDSQMYMYYEDTDLSWRAKLVGYSSQYSPDSVVNHDYKLNSSSLAHYYSERNRIVLMLKNWKWITLFLFLPSLLLAEIIDWGYVLLLGWEGIWAKLRAYGWLVMNLSKIHHARAGVQSSRTVPDWYLLKSCTDRLSPKLNTGGLIGREVTDVGNLWFILNYKIVFSFIQFLNI